MPVVRRLLLLALLGALGACSEHHGGGVEGPLAWGGLEDVRRYAHLYFAGQPDAAGLEAARQAGVSVVINLRAPSEHANCRVWFATTRTGINWFASAVIRTCCWWTTFSIRGTRWSR